MEEEKKTIVSREISKCSNCGLCLSACSAYQSTKDETFSPRAIISFTKYELANNLPFTCHCGCREDCECINMLNFEKLCPTGINLARICSNLT